MGRQEIIMTLDNGDRNHLLSTYAVPSPVLTLRMLYLLLRPVSLGSRKNGKCNLGSTRVFLSQMSWGDCMGNVSEATALE